MAKLTLVKLEDVKMSYLSDEGKIDGFKEDPNQIVKYNGNHYIIFFNGFIGKNKKYYAFAFRHGEKIFINDADGKEYSALNVLEIDIKESLKNRKDNSPYDLVVTGVDYISKGAAKYYASLNEKFRKLSLMFVKSDVLCD